jgi:arylsulfatase A-like enzyme
MRFLPVFFLALSVCVSNAAKPNVLVIVADDLGYHDVGFQGSKEIPTPHLDKLAASGVRCTSGYVSHPFCSPTRAGMLSGRYQHRFGHENNPAWLPESLTEGLPMEVMTFPTLMKQAGYTTGAVGKWHLGAHPQFHPMKRGFDEYFGALGGGHAYFPKGSKSAEYGIPLNRNGKDEAQTGYLTDQFGDEAAAFIGRHADGEKPWMLYLAFNAPHTPLEAPKEWLEKFQHIENQSRRTYAAMVAAMDKAIGEVMSKMEAEGETENTLVFFVSDNGGPNLAGKSGTNFTDNTPLRGSKGELYEGGVRVPFLVSWPAKIKSGDYEQPVIALDFLATSLAAAGESALAPKHLDGVNLLPFLTGETSGVPHETLFWRSGGFKGKHSVRRGDWKLVSGAAKEPELYYLGADVGEAKDLAKEKPEVVGELVEAIREWEKGTVAPVFGGTAAPKATPKKGKK